MDCRYPRTEGRAEALALRARLTYRQGDPVGALRYIEEGIRLAEAVSYQPGMGMLLRIRADLLWMQGNIETALGVAQQALAIYEGLDDLDGRARTLNSVSAVYHMMGNHHRSIKYALRAVSILEAIQDVTGLRVVYSNLGESYQRLYAMEKALYYHEKAMALSGSAVHADLIRNLGVDLVAVGRVEEGLGRLREALAISRNIKENDMIMQSLHSLSEALLGTGAVTEAHSLAQEALDMATPINAPRHIIRARLNLGRAAHTAGEKEKAQDHLHEGFIVAQNANDKTMIWQAHAALAEVLSADQPEIARVHAGIAADMINIMLNSIEDDALQQTFRTAPPIAKVLGMIAPPRRTRPLTTY
ncbi:MAG TPA: tetratricopeptide repeat protein [Aggregatilineales bacterium]|nr:tetratricopeptide repeat protein [Aggregatilineales bacterium]